MGLIKPVQNAAVSGKGTSGPLRAGGLLKKSLGFAFSTMLPSSILVIWRSTVKGGRKGLLEKAVSDGTWMSVKGGCSTSYRAGTRVTGAKLSRIRRLLELGIAA